jgi:hypothetical protein
MIGNTSRPGVREGSKRSSDDKSFGTQPSLGSLEHNNFMEISNMDPNYDETTHDGAAYAALIEQSTKSGRAYTKKRWTMGDSNDLVEGSPSESRLVTAAWIGIPIALMVIVVALMSQIG